MKHGLKYAFALGLVLICGLGPVRADPAFRAFLEALWPEAEALGVSRPTFDAATGPLTPDLNLPDLAIGGRTTGGGQAEFVQLPSEYLSERVLQNLAGRGRKLLDQHRATLAATERRFGVPGPVVLAIWGRETSFGDSKLPHDVLRALATQAYLGRRKERFRPELLAALKMMEDGHLTPARRKSSWAGAMGLVQFLPSDFARHAVDADGDGRADIWTSVPDALASAASQLRAKGWRPGRAWAHEVRPPPDLDCTMADPSRKATVAEWLRRGYAPADGRPIAQADLAEDASLLLPAGREGPAFLIPANYFVIKEYNFSDLYVLFVGSLADRIAGGGAFATPWPRLTQASAREIEEVQQRLTDLRFYDGKVDGKAGMATRLALGAFQKASGLVPDCWPSAAALARLRAAR